LEKLAYAAFLDQQCFTFSNARPWLEPALSVSWAFTKALSGDWLTRAFPV